MLKKKPIPQPENAARAATAPGTMQPGKRIIISPVDDPEPKMIALVGRAVENTFGYESEIMPLVQDVTFAHNPDRDQYYSTLILEKLAGKAPDRAAKILAVTGVDLFIPILTHVYGEAQIGGMACIVSTCRLKEDLPAGALEAFHRRVVKEAIHELGHTFNLRHCPDQACIMHYCRSIKDVDHKSEQFCRYCLVLLEDEIKRMSGV